MRRLLCVWLPGWPTLRLKREGGLKRSGAAPERPLATVAAVAGLRRLAAVCPLAEAAGLRDGMALTQARAICPDLAVADADPAGDRAALVTLAAWAERYTPLALADPPDGIVLDIAGCAHLFGDAAGLAGDLLARLARAGVPAHAAIAGSAEAGRALARWAPGLTVLPPGGERAALRDLPIALLRLDARCVAGLRRLGLRSIGELARLPRGEVSARFGPAPVQALDHAFCAVAEPLAWPHSPAPWCERLAFAEPIGAPEDFSRALSLLAARLCARLAAEVKGGQRFTATFLRSDGERPAITVATALPVRDAGYLTKLLAAKLETVDPGFGVDAMVLEADPPAPFAPPQTGFAGLAASAGATPPASELAASELAATVDDLANRLGEARLWRAAAYPSHIPERSVQRLPPLARPPAWPTADDPPRPLRLLRRPEAIEATAPVPDDPPILFRWRGCLHPVRAARGPERIAAEWWRHTAPAPPDAAGRDEADLVRDYYHVEDNDGARFWLFRTGRNAGAPGTRWFLHGVFG